MKIINCCIVISWFFSITFGQQKTIVIKTIPESCKVYINGTLKGISPIAFSENVDSMRLYIYKPGFVPYKSSNLLSTKTNDSMTIALSTASQLNIKSNPDSAVVFIDSVIYGRTPLLIDTITPRTISVLVVKKFHVSYENTITIAAGENISITPLLEPLKTTISITGNSSNSSYFLDNSPIIGNNSSMEKIFGSHHFVVVDTLTNQTAKLYFTLTTKEPRSFYAKMNTFSYEKMTTGIILPGWNQFNDGNMRKGQIFSGGAIGALLFFTFSELQYRSIHKDFLSAQNKYSHLSNSYALAAESRKNLDQQFDKLKASTTRSNASKIILLLIWSINAVDVVLNHSIENTIEETTKWLSVDHNSLNGHLTVQFQHQF